MITFLRFIILLFFTITILVLFLATEGVLEEFSENFLHINDTKIFIQIAESVLISIPVIAILFMIGSLNNNSNRDKKINNKKEEKI